MLFYTDIVVRLKHEIDRERDTPFFTSNRSVEVIIKELFELRNYELDSYWIVEKTFEDLIALINKKQQTGK